MANKAIVVRKEELHPRVRSTVEHVLGRREWRSTPEEFEDFFIPPYGLDFYITEGKRVRAMTEQVGNVARKVGVFDAKGKIKLQDVNKTHPIRLVNKQGDVVLLPNKLYQRALFNAQRTFLKHVLPARYRFK